MAKNFQLTWHAARKCWRKYRAGKVYYLGVGKCQQKYDIKGYDLALDEWREIERGIGQSKSKSRGMFLTDPAQIHFQLISPPNASRAAVPDATLIDGHFVSEFPRHAEFYAAVPDATLIDGHPRQRRCLGY